MTDLEKKDAMIEWLATQAWMPEGRYGFFHPAEAPCNNKQNCQPEFKCVKCWISAAEKAACKKEKRA